MTGVSASGLDLAWRLPEVRPQADLFRYVNGRWLDEVPIPDDRASCGTLLDLRDATELKLRGIAERAGAGGVLQGSDERKIGDLYASFLDEEQAERLGGTPTQPDLDGIARIDSPASFAFALGALQRKGIPGTFRFLVSADAHRSDRYLLHLSQGGFGLPDESYYRSERFSAIRAKYRAHIETVLRAANAADPAAAAGRVVALESRIASWHTDRATARDATKGYPRLDRAGLGELAPRFDWDAWLDGLQGCRSTLDEVVVRQPGFFGALSAALADTELADWRSWLSWQLLRAMSPLLSRAFSEESSRFYNTVLAGAPQQPPRWKRGLRVIESALGEALGRMYVAEHFPARNKECALALVGSLMEAHRRGIEALDWMSPVTKARALDKLAALTPKIGYPDQWRDYSAVVVQRDDLVGNVQRAQSAELDRQLTKIGKTVDRDEWPITPQTVNASYVAGTNQIVFPAAILQPPLFSPDADAAVNYGAIGAVIGHEIVHGFDNQGSRYDAAGNLADWWSTCDRAAFDARAARVIAQFDALTPAQVPSEHVNGRLTVDENIGDLGGLVLAYRAYVVSLAGAEPPVIDGLTGPQRFFLSWARIWRGKVRDEDVIRRLTVDPHAPRELRCNAVARNLDEFHEAFQVRRGDGMWLEPADRVRIW